MKSIRRILVVQPYGIGDALFMTPLLRGLRTLPTVEAVDLLLGSRTEPVFLHNPHVDQIFSIDKGKWRVSGKGEALKELASLWKNLRGRYDLLIDFSLQREYGFYGAFLLRIPRRIGFNFKSRGIFLTQSVNLNGGFEAKHAVDFYCEVVKLLGLEIEDRFLEFYLSDEDREEAKRVLNGTGSPGDRFPRSPSPGEPVPRFVAVAPGGGESWGKDAVFKRWPSAHFFEMLSFLKERLDFEGVLVFGSQGERNLGEEIKKASPLPVINLSGELALGTCAALLEKAVLFLANDGGLVHLAHSLHVPLVAFYGPVDPFVYGPYPPTPQAVSIMREHLPCRPCYFRFRYNSACIDRECLTALYPEEVIEFLDEKHFWTTVCKT